MFDVDKFKNFNTKFEHAGGDAVLRHLGLFLRENFCRRAEDFACRLGGDEFAIVLPGAAPDMTLLRAKELCKGVRGLEVFNEEKRIGRVAVSIGVANYPANGSTVDSLRKAADVASFQAKKRGRNQVVVATLPKRASRPAGPGGTA
jgi:diguanylate cyclase (GGDEF)-like protein